LHPAMPFRMVVRQSGPSASRPDSPCGRVTIPDRRRCQDFRHAIYLAATVARSMVTVCTKYLEGNFVRCGFVSEARAARNTEPYRPIGGYAVPIVRRIFPAKAAPRRRRSRVRAFAGKGLATSSANGARGWRRHALSPMANVLTHGFRKTGGRFSRKALTPSRDSFVP
jgi:hypothetical protein